MPFSWERLREEERVAFHLDLTPVLKLSELCPWKKRTWQQHAPCGFESQVKQQTQPESWLGMQAVVRECDRDDHYHASSEEGAPQYKNSRRSQHLLGAAQSPEAEAAVFTQ